MRNNPLKGVDPLGLDVNVYFDRSAGTLTFIDRDTGQKIIVYNVFSGLPGYGEDQENGPIPEGSYLIGDSTYHGHTWQHPPLGNYYWNKLYRWDDGKEPSAEFYIKDRNGKWVKRSGLYMHTGRVSDGCVTVKSDRDKDHWLTYPQNSDWERAQEMMDKTKPRVVNGQSYRGTLYVY